MKPARRRPAHDDERQGPLALRLLPVVVLGLLLLAALAAPAFAQAGITASGLKVESRFAEYIRFSVKLQSDSNITAASVFARYNTGERPTTTQGKAELTPDKSVTAVFTRTLTRGALVPGTDVEYYWQAENANGQTLKTETFKYAYLDDRFDFKSLSSGKVTVYWYGADDSYGRERLRVCVAAIDRLTKQIGVDLQQEARIFIYRTRNDMLAALPSKGQTSDTTLTVLGELAGPNTVLLLGGDSNVNNTTAHELSHLVVHLATTNPLIGGVNIPAWLDEGLSMYNQDSVESGYTGALNQAIRTDSLISVRSLSAIAGQSDQVVLFYGEAYSVVKYLTETYGKDNMLKLLSVFKRGALVEGALEEVYGFGVQELDNRWRQTLGAPAAQATAPAGAAQASTPASSSPPPAAPSNVPINCACLAPLGLVLAWLITRRF